MAHVPAPRATGSKLATLDELRRAVAAVSPKPDGARPWLNLGRFCGEDGKDSATLPYESDRHGLLFGPTGSGKTTRWLVSNLLGDNLLNASVVVTDPKGELAAITGPWRKSNGHDVKVIDPFGKLKELTDADPKKYEKLIKSGIVESVGFNPLDMLDRGGPLFYDDAAALSEALIEIEEKDSHWSKSAQGLMTGLIMLEKAREGAKANLSNVRETLTAPVRYDPDNDKIPIAGLPTTAADAITKAAHLAKVKGKSELYSIDIIADLLARFTATNREIQSIVSTADTQTRWLVSPLVNSDLKKSGFDFSILKKKKTTVYIIIPAERMRTYSGWIRMLVVSALRSLYSPGGLRTVFLLDEMPAFGYLPPLADAFGIIRGFNMQIVGIAQDLVQLKDLYKTRWESFVANTGFTQFFAPNDMTTSEWVSKRVGEQVIDIYNISKTTTSINNIDPDRISTSESLTQQFRARFTPQELMSFPTGTGLLFYAGLGDPVRFMAPRYDDFTRYKEHEKRVSPSP